MKAILNNFFSIKSLRSFITASVILIVSFSSFLQDAHASHGMGMDLTYQQVGQDSFLVTLAFYRDCHGVYPDPTASLRMRSANCGRNLSTTMPLLGSGTETTPVCASLVTECNGGSFPGSEEYIYQKLIVLPAKCTDWTLSASICCRNAGITTINQPNTKSIFVETKLNNFISNSSPRFSNNPVPFVCANQTYCFNNGATDADGDSLVYTLVTPRTGVNLSDTITFKAGFDKTDPITSSPKVSLDPFTGDLCMFPTDSTQIGVLSIIVEEYRNGVLIGSIMRDIQLRILGCPNGNNLPSVSGIDSTSAKSIKVCANSNVSFNLYADDSDTAQTITMTWNNGIPGASFNVTAGKRPVGTFSWTPNNGNIRNQPYSFTVEVRDDNCPFSGLQVFSYFVYVVGVQAIVDSVFDPTCPNACDGRLTAQVLNGIPPFTYSWNDPSTQFGPRATGLCAGAYTVTGTDSTGCQTQAIVSIFDPKPMILTMDSVSVSCPGYTDGQAIVSGITEGVSPYTYTWEVSAGLQSTDTAFNLPKGTYSVTVTDSNGCTMTDSIQVPEPLPIDINMIAVTQVSCKGLNDGEATASVTGGTGPYTYQWDALSVFQTTDTAKNLIAGLHTLTITDSKGCTSVDTITITEPGSAIALALTKTDVDCKGDSTGTATIVASGGTPPYAYTWDPGTGSQTTATAINLPAGIYSVTVTDLNNCSAYPNIEIIEPNIALTITSVDSFVQCFGDVNGVLGVEVIGGTTPYTFLWDAAAASQTTQYASALGAGIYKVVVTDSIGCQDSSDVSLLQASAPLTVIIDRVNVTCNNGSDGSAYVSVSGGEPSYTIQWDTNTGSQTTDTAFNLKAGIYFVSIVDSFGCQVDTNITVTEPPPLLTLTTNSTNVTCFGDSNGTASVVVSGGTPPYSYLWSANSGSQTTDTAVGLKAGIYFVTVFDSNYCVTSPGILIEEPVMALSASISSHITSCFNGNDGYAYAQGIGGTGNNYTYQWNAAANSQVNDTAFNLAAGTYGVTVTDSFNCTFDTSVLVTQPSTPLVVNLSSTPILCFGGNTGFGYASAAGGGAPYTYLWKTGTQSNDTAIGLTRGYHSISVEDTLGCIITDSVYVGGPPEPTTGFADGYPVLCNEGNTGFAVAIGTGGTPPYTYVWGNNANNQVNDTAFNLRADTFMVTVIDSNGCDSVLSVIVTEPPALDDSIYISSNFNGSSIQCFGDTNGSATVVAFGGTTPYTYLWGASTGNQTTDTAFNLGEGIYTVDITDSNGCVKSANISLSSPEQNGITIDSLRHVSCFARNDGMILVAGVGGTAPYQYSWNTTPIQTGSLASNLAIGSYKVTITDTNGCPYDTTININQPTPLVLNKIEIDALCHNQNTGSAIAQVSGGTPPYSYLWMINQGIFQINDTAINLVAGSYPLNIKDAKGCELNDTATINEPPPITLSTSNNDTTCASSPVQVKASAVGGVPPFTYTWNPTASGSPSDTIRIVAPNVTTNYFVNAVDDNGCLSSVGQITIHVRSFTNNPIEAYRTQDICEGDSATIYGSINSIFPPYTFIWNSGDTGIGPHVVHPDTATYYIITAKDICQNESKDTVLVDVFTNPTINLPEILATGCEPLDVQFDDTSNTMSNLNYTWGFGDGNGSNRKSPLYTYSDDGTYDVTLSITSKEGCTSDNLSGPSKVIVSASPTASFITVPPVTDIRTPVIGLNNTSDRDSSIEYKWYYGDGDSSTIPFQIHSHTYADTGKYTITVYAYDNLTGCGTYFSYDIFIQSYYFLEIPSAFTPDPNPGNGQWRNDPAGNKIFFPYTIHPEAVVEYSMLIFNRWGEIIFQSEDIYTGWDGFYKKKASPQEVYVYKVKLRFENDQEFEKVGDVTLFR